MKYQVTASEYADLSEDVQKNYGSEKDGKHTLDVEGMPESKDDSGLKAKVEELLKEKKAEQSKREAAEQIAEEAKKEQSRKKGDYESLLKSSEKENIELKDKLSKRDEREAKKDVSLASMKISAILSEGKNQGLMSTFVEKRLRSVDGEMKVTDAEGNLTISTLDQLTEEFRNDDTYASLIIGTKAAGGGALGTQRDGVAQSKTVTNAQWADMNPSQKMEFSKDGGQVTET